MQHRLLFLLLHIILIGTITACEPTASTSSNLTGDVAEGYGSVAPRFREFYDLHGGEGLLA